MFIKRRIKNKVFQFFAWNFKKLLNDPEIYNRIWEIVHGSVEIQHSKQGNIRTQLWQKATEETVDYVNKKMLTVKSYCGRERLFEEAISNIKIDGLYLEFGVGKGESINFIAKNANNIVHGFDSFEGLPEKWFDEFGEKKFSTDGNLPVCHERVKLHAGWFDETLPKFISVYKDPIAFMHIDCDLYSSTKIIFDYLGDRIIKGTVIQFDEYFNYPGWKNHEFKAFQEFISERKLRYNYLGYDRCNFSVAVIIK